MRSHLLNCIEKGVMEEFSTVREPRLKTDKIPCSRTRYHVVIKLFESSIKLFYAEILTVAL